MAILKNSSKTYFLCHKAISLFLVLQREKMSVASILKQKYQHLLHLQNLKFGVFVTNFADNIAQSCCVIHVLNDVTIESLSS